jgi:uncharacterized coiled-coil protein SlyX
MVELSVTSNVGAAAGSIPDRQTQTVATVSHVRGCLTLTLPTDRNDTFPMTADSLPPHADDRLTKLELLLSHLQYDVDKLNAALISQQAQIDELRQSLSKVQGVLEHLPETPRDLEQERPPHY